MLHVVSPMHGAPARSPPQHTPRVPGSASPPSMGPAIVEASLARVDAIR